MKNTSCIEVVGPYTGQIHPTTRRPHGRGVLTRANGDKYDGEWKCGRTHGHGVLASADGDKYDGEWKDDKRNGRGVLTFANGDKYEGE
jgi:hypothetical protein